MKKDHAPLLTVKKHLSELREAWEVISTRKGLEEKGGSVSGVNIAG